QQQQQQVHTLKQRDACARCAALLLSLAVRHRDALSPGQWHAVVWGAARLATPLRADWLRLMLRSAPTDGGSSSRSSSSCTRGGSSAGGGGGGSSLEVNPKLLTDLISACSSWQELQAVVSACADQLDAIHVAAAWSRLARLLAPAALTEGEDGM
ncbi:hypothetical protein MNEG_13767, partial [Monoraphidium neglectum]